LDRSKILRGLFLVPEKIRGGKNIFRCKRGGLGANWLSKKGGRSSPTPLINMIKKGSMAVFSLRVEERTCLLGGEKAPKRNDDHTYHNLKKWVLGEDANRRKRGESRRESHPGKVTS